MNWEVCGRSMFSSRSINNMNWEVCGSNTETKGVSNVVHSLDNSIGIDVAVSSSGNTVSRLDLLLDRVGVTVAIAVLAKVILAVVLGSLWCCSMDNGGSSHNRGSNRCSDVVDLLGRLRGDRGNGLLSKDHRGRHCTGSNSRGVVQGEILRLDGSCSISLCMSQSMCLLGGSYFRGVNNRSRQSHSSLGKVSASHTEPCSICNVLHSLHHARGVNVPICSPDHTVGSLDLLPHRVRVIVAKAVLAEIVLGVVLGASCIDSSRLNNRCNWNGGGYWLHIVGGLNNRGCRDSVHILSGRDVVVVALGVGQVSVVN